jgi:hypothetical protein
MNDRDDDNLIEEIELKDQEQRIEFGCCGGDGGGGPGGGGGGGGGDDPPTMPN